MWSRWTIWRRSTVPSRRSKHSAAVLGDSVVDVAIKPLIEQRARLAERTGVEQRRLVTVLFSDLVDFTVMSQRLDAEDVRTVINAYFLRWQRAHRGQRRRGREVHRRCRDGSVRAAQGRRGRPAPGHPRGAGDDAPRSTSSTPSSRRPTASRSTMRVGIDTGDVVVSTLGDRPGQDFVVVGEIVNRPAASRAAAPPGGVLVSADTYPPCPRLLRRAAA